MLLQLSKRPLQDLCDFVLCQAQCSGDDFVRNPFRMTGNDVGEAVFAVSQQDEVRINLQAFLIFHRNDR